MWLLITNLHSDICDSFVYEFIIQQIFEYSSSEVLETQW